MKHVNRQQGFTLLEMLVVLVVIAMSASFAGPNLWNSYVKSNERSTVQGFADAVMQLRQDAFHQGTSILLPAVLNETVPAGGLLPALPDGWVLEKSDSIRLLPSGVTNGGSFYLRSSVANRWLLTLAPLDGRGKISKL